jgi:hypothetical protein
MEIKMSDQVTPETEIPVRFEVRGHVVDVESLNRLSRRLIETQANKYRKKFAGTVGPNGELPTIVLRKPDLTGLKVEVVLEFPESMKDIVKGSDKAVRVG